MDPLALLQEFVSIPGPAGQEAAVNRAVAAQVDALGLVHETDAKGNLLVRIGTGKPEIVVTAHMDEIGMIVRQVRPDGSLEVTRLGGLFPWKMGEGPVFILARTGAIPGIFGFGGIHTEDPSAACVKARTQSVDWNMASVFTGKSPTQLAEAGVRPGTRVVIAPSRRNLSILGDHVAGYFLDDRADLVSWLLALDELKDSGQNLLFAATAAEEVGGEGALYLLQELRPAVCIALELGALVPDARVQLSAVPTVWTVDGYAATSAADLDLIAEVGQELGLNLQFQAFSRGGSDASCAASHGLCARPLTLGLPMANSHGFEIMHCDAMTELAKLTVALIKKISLMG